MFERDYIMRLIKEMVRAILKFLFNIDTENPTAELLEDEKTESILGVLTDMVDEGNIDEAENHIYEMIADKDMAYLKTALLFYSYLNDKDDIFLQEHNFSREEIYLGIKNVASIYGISELADVFLM